MNGKTISVKIFLVLILTLVLLLPESIYASEQSNSAWHLVFSDKEIKGGLNGIAWNESIYVAVGGKNTILTSSDSMQWTKLTVQGGWYRDIVWGGNKFVIVTEDGGVLISSDGKEWSYKKVSNKGFRDITWTGKQFVAVGEKGVIASSNDGIKWTEKELGTSDTLQGIFYNGKTFIVVKENEYDGKALFTSSDGIKWIRRQLPKKNMLSSVAWNGKYFIAVGDGGIIYSSTDGSKWVEIDSDINNNLYDIVWNGKKFCVVGSEGTIIESTDGLKWTRINTITDSWLMNIIWNGNYFVSVGGSLYRDAGTIITDNSTKKATPADVKVLVNGKEVSILTYTIDGNNHFKIRDLAKVITGTEKQFEVEWDKAKKCINMTQNKPYTTVGGELDVLVELTEKEAKITTSKVYVNGKEVKLNTYNIDGNNYFKIRDIARVIDFGVSWEGTNRTLGIDTSSTYTE